MGKMFVVSRRSIQPFPIIARLLPSSVHLNLIVYRVVLYVLKALGKSIHTLQLLKRDDANGCSGSTKIRGMSRGNQKQFKP